MRDAGHNRSLRCRNWRAEGLLRLLENVLAVGEAPEKLIVYASLGKAARDWPAHDAIVATLKTLEPGHTLVIQSGKPIGVLRTHERAPLVVMANCNLVGRWATAEQFYELERRNLICWGGLTAGAWQYIGSQGVIEGTYEIFACIAERRFGGNLRGRMILTAGLGGMGGAQPLAGRMAEAAILVVDVDQTRIEKRRAAGFLQVQAHNLDEALSRLRAAQAASEPLSVGLLGNAAEVFPELLARGVVPDIVTDQTAAHDLLYGYVPADYTLEQVRQLRQSDPQRVMAASRRSIARQVEAMLGFRDRGAEVFDNGNLIRAQAHAQGVTRAFEIPVFTEAYLRPMFCHAIGPFRWIALSGNEHDIRLIDDLVLETFAKNARVTRWIRLAREHVPFEGLPARVAWLGHGERTRIALAVNAMVRAGQLAGPVAFTRDHLDAAAMVHPNIMTENMLDGSDAIADWPLLDAMTLCASGADLVAVHSGGGGYAGFMTSAGVTLIADGTPDADVRLELSLTNDTSLGVMRYADAGYGDARDEVKHSGLMHIDTARQETTNDRL